MNNKPQMNTVHFVKAQDMLLEHCDPQHLLKSMRDSVWKGGT